MNTNDLREIAKAFRKAMACPYCGGSVFVAATGWRGHGTGQHGSAQYEATSHETVSPETHCTCPGGPMWDQILATELGQFLRLEEGVDIPGLPEGHIAQYIEGQWMSAPAEVFRRAVEVYFSGEQLDEEE